MTSYLGAACRMCCKCCTPYHFSVIRAHMRGSFVPRCVRAALCCLVLPCALCCLVPCAGLSCSSSRKRSASCGISGRPRLVIRLLFSLWHRNVQQANESLVQCKVGQAKVTFCASEPVARRSIVCFPSTTGVLRGALEVEIACTTACLILSVPDLLLSVLDNLPMQAKLNEYEFPVKKVANVQAQLSRLIEKNYYLNKSAREVSATYMQYGNVGWLYTLWSPSAIIKMK